jgi:ABC-2 type transport system ATP-binding protein
VDDVGKAMLVLQSTPGVTRVEAEPPGIAVVLNGVARKEIVASLVHSGIGVETVATRRRLEEAFLGMMEEEEA